MWKAQCVSSFRQELTLPLLIFLNLKLKKKKRNSKIVYPRLVLCICIPSINCNETITSDVGYHVYCQLCLEELTTQNATATLSSKIVPYPSADLHG